MRLKSLRVREKVLDLPTSLEDFSDAPDPYLAHHRRLKLQLEAANKHVTDAIKVDDQAFRAQQHEDAMALLAQKMDEAEKRLPKPKSD